MSDKAMRRFSVWLWIFLGMIPLGIGLILLFTSGSIVSVARTLGDDAGPVEGVYGGIAIFTIGILGSIITFIVGITKGVNEFKGTGHVQSVPHVIVMSKYVLNRNGEFVTEEYLWETEPKLRFFVKMKLPNGELREFLTTMRVYMNCGDGMRGEAVIDGKWLGSFTAYIGREGAV